MSDVPRIKVITSWATLMRFAAEEAKARQAGDPVALARAEKRHAEYRALCLEADQMIVAAPVNL